MTGHLTPLPPIYRTTKMEPAANLLAKTFGKVLIHAQYTMHPKVRIRADLLDPPVFFSQTKSQVTRWQNGGGSLMLHDRRLRVGSFQALFFPECPRSVELLDRYSQEAQVLVVVHWPTSWKIHYACIQDRFSRKRPGKLREALDAMQRMIDLLEASPAFTPSSLDRLLIAQELEKSPRLSVPGSPANAERAAGTTVGVP
jgi:hypothetical protein